MVQQVKIESDFLIIIDKLSSMKPICPHTRLTAVNTPFMYIQTVQNTEHRCCTVRGARSRHRSFHHVRNTRARAHSTSAHMWSSQVTYESEASLPHIQSNNQNNGNECNYTGRVLFIFTFTKENRIWILGHKRKPPRLQLILSRDDPSLMICWCKVIRPGGRSH